MSDVKLVGLEFNRAKVEDEYNLVLSTGPAGHKVSWIKAFRAVTGTGLKGSRNLYEQLEFNKVDEGADLNFLTEEDIENLKYFQFDIKVKASKNETYYSEMSKLIDDALENKDYNLAEDLIAVMKKNNI